METVAPPRQLKIGSIIDKTLGVMEHAAMPAAIFVVGLAIASAAIKYFTLNMGPLEQAGVSFVQVVVTLAASYFLLDTMLRKTGLSSRSGEDMFFAYFGLTILYTLGTWAGLIALVLPGLVIMARWSLAAPMMLARGDGVMRALGGSWERTKGNEFQIIVAMLALYLVPIALIIAASVMFDPADPVGIVVTQVVSSAMSALGVALGVALYGLMVGHRTASTFE
jgi:hypothetical protein